MLTSSSNNRIFGTQDQIHPLRLLTLAQLESIPRPEYLIDGVLPANSINLWFGPSGSGKTFVAIGAAMHVAAGVEWCGHQVKQGSVLYIAAEGASGLHARASSWMGYHSAEHMPHIWFISEPVQLLHDLELDRLLDAVEKTQPVLIVVDTFARCFVDGDENSARDAGRAINNLRKLQRVCGSCVLVIHHTGHENRRERGSSALRGAMDSMALITSVNRGLELRCEKMKEGPKYPTKGFKLHPFQSSCVAIAAAISSEAIGADSRIETESWVDDKLLKALAEGPMKHKEWKAVSKTMFGVAKTSYDKSLRRLKDSRKVVVDEDGFYSLVD